MEFRKDYVLDRWVVISAGRAKRKHEYVEKVQKKKGVCFFCPGNEEMTPPEIGRIAKGKSWLIRWFPNKFPAVQREGVPEFLTDPYIHGDAFGSHEVVAETPDHDKQLWDLPVKHISQLLAVWASRVQDLEKNDGVKYVVVFKNHGEAAGCSLIHSHTQIATLDFVPPAVVEEARAAVKNCRCAYCRIIRHERKSPRFIFENKGFIVLAPYASRFNYEVWIFSKKHLRTFADFAQDDYEQCAEALAGVLRKLKKLNLDYNFWLHYSPKGRDLHFHIEVAPRRAPWAGFEYSSGVIINAVPPEEAAKFYRK